MRESQKVEGIRSIKSRCMTSIGEGVKEDRNEIVYPLKSSGKVNDPIVIVWRQVLEGGRKRDCSRHKVNSCVIRVQWDLKIPL